MLRPKQRTSSLVAESKARYMSEERITMGTAGVSVRRTLPITGNRMCTPIRTITSEILQLAKKAGPSQEFTRTIPSTEEIDANALSKQIIDYRLPSSS
jgi:hypothetical protein